MCRDLPAFPMDGGREYRVKFQLRNNSVGSGYFVCPICPYDPINEIFGIDSTGDWEDYELFWESGNCSLYGTGGPSGGGTELRNLKFYRCTF